MMCFTGVYDLVLLPLKLDMLGQCNKQSQLHFETRNIFNVTRNTLTLSINVEVLQSSYFYFCSYFMWPRRTGLTLVLFLLSLP